MRKTKARIESSLRTQNHTHTQNKLGMERRISTMPDMYNRNFRILRTIGIHQAKISRADYIAQQAPVCPQCVSSHLQFYDHYYRKADFINDEGVKRLLIIKAKRYRCLECKRLFREPIEGLKPKKRSSEAYRQQIAREYIKNVSNKTIALEFNLSQSTVERIIHERFELKIKEALSYPAPLIIGIDEHSIHKGRKFATTIADLANHRVYDIMEGKSLSSLESRLKSYQDRDKVKMVCMGPKPRLSEYRSALFSQRKNWALR